MFFSPDTAPFLIDIGLFGFTLAIALLLLQQRGGSEKRLPRSPVILVLISLGIGTVGTVLLLGEKSSERSGTDTGETPSYSRQSVQTRGNFVSPEEVERLIRDQISQERASRASRALSPDGERPAQSPDADQLRSLIRQIVEEELLRATVPAIDAPKVAPKAEAEVATGDTESEKSESLASAESPTSDVAPAPAPPSLSEADVLALIPASLTEMEVRRIVLELLPESKWNEGRIREIAEETVDAEAIKQNEVEIIAEKVAANERVTPKDIRGVVGGMNLAGQLHDHESKIDPETYARLDAIEASLKEIAGKDIPIVSEVIEAKLYAPAIKARLGAPRDALTLRVDEVEASGRVANLTLTINGVDYKARNLGVNSSFGPFPVGEREYVFKITRIIGVPENRVYGVLRME